jgi:hypothetical protein
MTMPLGPPRQPPPPRSPSGCLVLIGALMLLPGVCALMFASSNFKLILTDPPSLLLVVIGLAIAAGGLVLIIRQ